VDGPYTILLDPRSAFTGSITLTLSTDLGTAITIDGPAMTLDLSRAGRRARVTFAGTTGQQLSLGLTGVTISQSDISILKPDQTALVAPTVVTTNGGAIDLPLLPVDGPFTILVDPRSVFTGTITLTLARGGGGGGDPTPLELDQPQTMTARLGVPVLFDLTVPPGAESLFLRLQKDRSWLGTIKALRVGATISMISGGADLLLQIPGPAAGQYRIEISGNGGGLVTASLSLPQLPLGQLVVGTIRRQWGSASRLRRLVSQASSRSIAVNFWGRNGGLRLGTE
jgi:hypothetical protein